MSIIGLIFYASKYYIVGNLFIGSNLIYIFTFVSLIALFSLIMGIVNSIQTENLKNQNKILLNKVEDLSNKLDNYHYSEMKSIHSNMEVILKKGEQDELL